MIDYVFKFTNEAEAISDVVLGAAYRPALSVGPFLTAASWRGDCVCPDLKAWLASQDVVETTQGPLGTPLSSVTHTYLPGWYILVAFDGEVDAFVNHPNLSLAISRDDGSIVKSNVTLPLNDLRTSVIFAGSNYQFGAIVPQ